MKQAFTLIELLVVILIIGILSAIALPQYQAAVMKSRLVEIEQTVSTIKREFELYRLTNGTYPPAQWKDFKDTFNVDFPACSSYSLGYLSCKNFTVDVWEHNLYVIIGFASGYQYGFAQWLEGSENANRRECLACETNPTALQMCKSFGGEQVRTVQYTGCKMLAYSMP